MNGFECHCALLCADRERGSVRLEGVLDRLSELDTALALATTRGGERQAAEGRRLGADCAALVAASDKALGERMSALEAIIRPLIASLISIILSPWGIAARRFSETGGS